MRDVVELNLTGNLAIVAGASYDDKFFQLTEEDGTTPISLEDYTGTWTLSQTLGVSEIAGTVTIGTINADVDGTNYSSTLGWFKLSLTKTQTALMPPQSRWYSRIFLNEPSPSTRVWGFATGVAEVI